MLTAGRTQAHACLPGWRESFWCAVVCFEVRWCFQGFEFRVALGAYVLLNYSGNPLFDLVLNAVFIRRGGTITKWCDGGTSFQGLPISDRAIFGGDARTTIDMDIRPSPKLNRYYCLLANILLFRQNSLERDFLKGQLRATKYDDMSLLHKRERIRVMCLRLRDFSSPGFIINFKSEFFSVFFFKKSAYR
jgi:hypothetical protein